MKLQNADFKTEAELITAGATEAELLNDTKIYVTATGLNKKLSQAIIDGDLAGGGGGSKVILGVGQSSGQSIPNGTNTTVIFNDVDIDTDSIYSTISGEATIPKAGNYLVGGYVRYNATATWAASERSIAYVQVNGVDVINSVNYAPPGVSVTAHAFIVLRVIPLALNDVVRFRLLQESGAALALTASNVSNYFSIVEV